MAILNQIGYIFISQFFKTLFGLLTQPPFQSSEVNRGLFDAPAGGYVFFFHAPSAHNLPSWSALDGDSSWEPVDLLPSH